MRELDGDIANVLRDVVDFLEGLVEVELSEGHRVTREALLARSRTALDQRQQRRQSSVSPDSPEPYLDMNAGKSMLLLLADEAEQPQEYVGADERQAQRGSLQHYYETFQDFQGAGDRGRGDGKTDANGKEMDNIVLLYASFSAAQAKSKSAKCGQLLHLKRERKMFAPFNVFWLNRHCWVSLVGSHLLLYANDRESRPYLVVPLRGYKSRAAPGALSRDPRRSEAAFEIYCPGDPTFQFLAKNAQEMREWVEALGRSLETETAGKTKTRAATFVEILELESNERMCIERVKEEKEKYQDVLNSPKSKTKEKQLVAKAAVTPEKEKVVAAAEEPREESAPPLPARSRRLPSLPSQETIAYEPKEELYDEEGLYHRIEDVKAQRAYQNCHLRTTGETAKDGKSSVATVDLVQETYDDVETAVDKSRERTDEPGETYDDVYSVAQDRAKNEPISYDDVQTISENLRAKTDKEKPLKPSKPIQKRSFLDRVRNRKESMRKDDKKSKSPTPTTPSSPAVAAVAASAVVASSLTTPSVTPISNTTEHELPCYDDVSSCLQTTAGREGSIVGSLTADEEDYLTPPPPRPIYSRPPTIVKCALPSDEIYDDIGSATRVEANGNGSGCKGCANVDVIKDYPKNSSFLSDLQLSIDFEHYQVPKSGIRRVFEHQEELYDDVALSETFKNRQRDSPLQNNSAPASSPERSVWSRFGSGKRPRIFDHVSRQTSCSDSMDSADDVAGEQQQQHTKVKPFQKLISKMENTLGKATKTNGVTQN